MGTYIVQHMKESLKDHVLVEVPTGDIRTFYLKRPEKSRMMSALLIFSPEGIIICGDLRIGDHGVVSDYGYGLDWFAGELGEDYLCSKFLKREWQSEVAMAWAEDEHDTHPQPFDTEQEFLNIYGMELAGDGVGYDYSPAAAGWLCAIQQRFRELYVLYQKGHSLTPPSPQLVGQEG